MFEGSLLKVRRAKQHIADLEARSEMFFASNPSILSAVDDLEPGHRSIVARVGEPVPAEFALMLGDAIHNLRSSLDLLAWQIISPVAGVDEKQVGFPVGKNLEHFAKVIKSRQIEMTHRPDIVEAFLNTKAFDGGNDLLYGLHRLDIADKHKLVIPEVRYFGVNNLDLERLDPALQRTKLYAGVVSNSEGNSIFSWPLAAESPSLDFVQEAIGKDGGARLDSALAFGRVHTFHGKLVIFTMKQIALEVEAVIASFATLGY